MGNSIAPLMSVIMVMAICGMAGYRIAKDHGRNPFFGLALGAAIPLAGVGILLLLGRKTRR